MEKSTSSFFHNGLASIQRSLKQNILVCLFNRLFVLFNCVFGCCRAPVVDHVSLEMEKLTRELNLKLQNPNTLTKCPAARALMSDSSPASTAVATQQANRRAFVPGSSSDVPLTPIRLNMATRRERISIRYNYIEIED